MAHPRITPSERARMVKLLDEGKNKAEIGRIMRRSRRIVWKTLKEFHGRSSRRRRPGERRRQAQPRAKSILWWSPAAVLDAFGD